MRRRHQCAVGKFGACCCWPGHVAACGTLKRVAAMQSVERTLKLSSSAANGALSSLHGRYQNALICMHRATPHECERLVDAYDSAPANGVELLQLFRCEASAIPQCSQRGLWPPRAGVLGFQGGAGDVSDVVLQLHQRRWKAPVRAVNDDAHLGNAVQAGRSQEPHAGKAGSWHCKTGLLALNILIGPCTVKSPC